MIVTESHAASLLVTKHEAMDALQVSLRTVDRYIADGRLRAIRLTPRTTRIVRESLEAMLAGETPDPAPAPIGVEAGAPASPGYGAPALPTTAALAEGGEA